MSKQIAVRVPDELAAFVDGEVEGAKLPAARQSSIGHWIGSGVVGQTPGFAPQARPAGPPRALDAVGWVLILRTIVQYSALMGMDAESLAAVIGSRVRTERTGRGWTLDRLAEGAGVSRRMVVNVEQGTVNPSIGTLLRLSSALGVGLPALVEPPRQERAKVTRAGDGAVLWTGSAGGRGVLVASTESPDVVELWDWMLAPGEEHASPAHSAGTRELLQVHDGNLLVTVAEQEFALAAGDALAFVGDEDHAYANPGAVTTRFSLSVYEPGPGRRTGTGHE